VARLGDVATVDPEGVDGSGEEVIDYISLEDVSKGKIASSARFRLAEAPSRARRRIQAGDVLFGTVRPNLQSHAQYRGGLENPVASTGFAVIRARPGEAVPGFLAQWVLAAEASRQVGRLITGSNYPAISSSDVREFEIRLPDESGQLAIATVLDQADELIAATERSIAKKRAVKEGLLQHLLGGRGRLPGFDAPWAETTFDQIASPVRDQVMPQTVPPSTLLVELEHIESRAGRRTAAATAAESSSLKTAFEQGDVLFGKLRAYLRKYWYADGPGLCTTEMWVLRAKAGIDGRFVRYVVETERFIEAASGGYGTHMPRSDWGVVKELKVSVPPLDEQRAIASVLVEADREVALLQQWLAKVRAVKAGMAQELLGGRTRLPAVEVAE
jgi:type I restriction enzyme S subunit